MKKLFSVMLSLAMCFSFSACCKSGEMNLLMFTDNLNSIEGRKEISLSDFFVLDGCYKLIVEDGATLLITAEEDENKVLKKIRLTISKADDKGNIRALSESEASAFNKQATDILEAFTMYERTECEDVLKDLIPKNAEAFSKEGELVTEKENFHLVYYSNKICSQFFVTDTYYEKTESTTKPDNINP